MKQNAKSAARQRPANLLTVMRYAFSAAAGLLFVCALFFNNATAFVFKPKEQALSFAAVATVFCLSAYLARFFAKRETFGNLLRKRHAFVIYASTLIAFVLQMACASLIRSGFENDLRVIVSSAQAEYVSHGYFSAYTNNFLILFFFRFIYKVLALFNLSGIFVQTLITVNIIFVDAAVILTFHAVKKAFGLYRAFLAWVFALLAAGFSPQIITPYSDTLSMPFVIGTVFLYVTLQAKRVKVAGLGLGAVSCVGRLFKPTAVIPFIAVFIVSLIEDARRPKSKSTRRRLKYGRIDTLSKPLVICALPVFVLAGVFFNIFIRAQTSVAFTDGVAFPAEHYIATGMQRQPVGDRFSYGAYSADDFYYTAGFYSASEKRRANFEVIKSRLADFGLTGYIGFLANKARWITGDGTFHWGEFAYGEFESASPPPPRLRCGTCFFRAGETTRITRICRKGCGFL